VDDVNEWVVAGPCTVAGVAPGGTVSRKVLDAASANIDALLTGGHLKPAGPSAQGEGAAPGGGDGGGDGADAAGASPGRRKAASK
jgi:hypothetical protein